MATTVKNTANGPRGIRNASGDVVMIEAGQSVEGDFSAAEVKDFKAMLSYEAGESPAAETETAEEAKPKALDKMNKAELLEVAAAENVAVETDDNKADLVHKIEEARGATK